MCAKTCPECHNSLPCVRQHVSPHGGLPVVLGTSKSSGRKRGWAPASMLPVTGYSKRLSRSSAWLVLTVLNTYVFGADLSIWHSIPLRHCICSMGHSPRTQTSDGAGRGRSPAQRTALGSTFLPIASADPWPWPRSWTHQGRTSTKRQVAQEMNKQTRSGC